MSTQKTYSKKEISRILRKASEIQTQKDLYGDKEGLDREELVSLAKEVGIDESSLLEALYKYNDQDLETSFNWLRGTARIQKITNVENEITDEIWDEVVQEIRKINGGIGKLIRTNQSFEWEQRMREIGYKHISFTPKKGSTKIQYVSSWAPLRFMTLFMSTFMFGVLSLIFFKGIGFPKEIAVLFTPVGGIIGFSSGILFLKAKFEKEKNKLVSIINAVSGKIRSIKNPEIKIESEDVYTNDSNLEDSVSKEIKTS
ncbi:MAG: hypothetical protein BalsKO_10470 [Balneolaceae bacterium]